MILNFFFVILVLSTVFGVLPERYNRYNYYNDPVVSRFREYIAIDTSQYKNIDKAVQFWRNQAEDVGLPMVVYEPAGKPIVVITWQGLDPSLPSIMLNSHMDVVSADETQWTYPPFSAHIDDDGNIFGRGTQDTKDVGMQYLEAIRRLKNDNMNLLRTIHITIMPDEEVGGYDGMKSFVKTQDFEALNVGFALDEGLSSINDTLFAVYQDRRPWQMEFTIFGDGGHGSMMPENNAAEKVARFISHFVDLRNENMKIMRAHHSLDFGKYTSVNINMMHGGVAVNVIPTNYTVGIDIRLSSDSDIAELDEMIKSWMDEAGADTLISYIRREEVSEKTVLDETNLYWMAMKSAVNDMGYELVTIVCPATTDMLNLRNMGYPAVGFAPKLHTVSKIHGNDEYINVETYLHGIDIYYEIIRNVANTPHLDGTQYYYKYYK